MASLAIDYAGKFAMVGVFVLAAYWSRRPVADYLASLPAERRGIITR